MRHMKDLELLMSLPEFKQCSFKGIRKAQELFIQRSLQCFQLLLDEKRQRIELFVEAVMIQHSHKAQQSAEHGCLELRAEEEKLRQEIECLHQRELLGNTEPIEGVVAQTSAIFAAFVSSEADDRVEQYVERHGLAPVFALLNEALSRMVCEAEEEAVWHDMMTAATRDAREAQAREEARLRQLELEAAAEAQALEEARRKEEAEEVMRLRLAQDIIEREERERRAVELLRKSQQQEALLSLYREQAAPNTEGVPIDMILNLADVHRVSLEEQIERERLITAEGLVRAARLYCLETTIAHPLQLSLLELRETTIRQKIMMAEMTEAIVLGAATPLLEQSRHFLFGICPTCHDRPGPGSQTAQELLRAVSDSPDYSESSAAASASTTGSSICESYRAPSLKAQFARGISLLVDLEYRHGHLLEAEKANRQQLCQAEEDGFNDKILSLFNAEWGLARLREREAATRAALYRVYASEVLQHIHTVHRLHTEASKEVVLRRAFFNHYYHKGPADSSMPPIRSHTDTIYEKEKEEKLAKLKEQVCHAFDDIDPERREVTLSSSAKDKESRPISFYRNTYQSALLPPSKRNHFPTPPAKTAPTGTVGSDYPDKASRFEFEVTGTAAGIHGRTPEPSHPFAAGAMAIYRTYSGESRPLLAGAPVGQAVAGPKVSDAASALDYTILGGGGDDRCRGPPLFAPRPPTSTLVLCTADTDEPQHYMDTTHNIRYRPASAVNLPRPPSDEAEAQAVPGGEDNQSLYPHATLRSARAAMYVPVRTPKAFVKVPATSIKKADVDFDFITKYKDYSDLCRQVAFANQREEAIGRQWADHERSYNPFIDGNEGNVIGILSHLSTSKQLQKEFLAASRDRVQALDLAIQHRGSGYADHRSSQGSEVTTEAKIRRTSSALKAFHPPRPPGAPDGITIHPYLNQVNAFNAADVDGLPAMCLRLHLAEFYDEVASRQALAAEEQQARHLIRRAYVQEGDTLRAKEGAEGKARCHKPAHNLYFKYDPVHKREKMLQIQQRLLAGDITESAAQALMAEDGIFDEATFEKTINDRFGAVSAAIQAAAATARLVQEDEQLPRAPVWDAVARKWKMF